MSNNVSSIAIVTKNPFNIRYDANNDWLGSIHGKDYKGFACFIDRIYGLRAGIVLLNNYRKRGLSSVRSIVNRFAPPSENKTSAYVDFVSAWCVENGINPDCLMWDATCVYVLCRSMLKLESNFHLTLSEFSYIVERFDIKFL